MKKIIFIYLFILTQSILYGQLVSVPMSLGLGAGVDIISNKDIAASPLRYKGMALPIGINGFKMNQKWINHFEIRLVSPSITNNYPLNSSVNTSLVEWGKVDVRYELLHRIGTGQNNYLGGTLKSNFFLREYDFLDGFSWEFQNSLNVSFARKINVNQKSFVLAQVTLPVFGYINRKPSLTFDEPFLDDFNANGAVGLLKYGEWKIHFDEWFSYEFNFLYHLELSSHFNFQTRLGLNYYSIQFPEKVHHINIPIQCYINYQF